MKEIFDGLTPVLKLVGNAPVLIQSTGDKIYVASHNENHATIYTVEAKYPKFAVTLDPESAVQLSRNFSGGEITVGGESIEVKTPLGKGNFTLIPNQFTISGLASHYSEDDPITIDPGEFSRLFKEVVHASNSSAVGDARFKGFHLTYSPEGLEVMASDSNVISASTSTSSTKSPDTGTLILNPAFSGIASFVSTLEKVSLFPGKEAVSLKAKIDDGVLRVVSTLTKGSPVPYQPIVEKVTAANTNEYRISRVPFVEALGRLSYFTGEHSRISMKIEDEECKVSVGNIKGEAELSLNISKVDSSQNSWDIGINLGYLLSYLKSTKESDISMWLGGNKLPVLLGYGTNREVITVFLA